MNFIKILLIIMFSILSISNAKTLETEDMQKKEISLYDSGIAAYQQGNYQSSIGYFKKSLAMSKKIYGAENYAISKNYHALSLLHKEIGEYSKSLQYSKKSLAIIEKTLGTEHAETAKVYNQIALIYEAIGDYTNALQFYQKTLKIREKILGKDHIETANNYKNLGVIYRLMGNYPKALAFHEKSLNIRKKVLGKDHISTAQCYANIGLAYNNIGNSAKALTYHQKSLPIIKKILGDQHPDVALNYINQGSVYSEINDYPKALKYYQKALSIMKKIYGENHISTAKIYAHLGGFYSNLGNHSKGLEYEKKALNIFEKVLGKEHLYTAVNYASLSIRYQIMGDYTKALLYQKKALSVFEKVLGREHPKTAINYGLLGSLYKLMGDYPKALNYQHKALKIMQKVLGNEHPSIAGSYVLLGSLYEKMEDYSKALMYYQKALTIDEKFYGRKHISTGSIYHGLGTLYLKIKDYQKSYYYTKLSFDIFQKDRDKAFTILDSQQKEKYLKSTNAYMRLLLDISIKYLTQLKKEKKTTKALKVLQSGANAWLNYKGSIFDSENAIAMLYSSTKDSKIKEKIDDLVSTKRYLATLYQSLPKPKERDAWKKKIKNTELKIAALTNQIASKASSFKEQQGLKSISYKGISSHLKKGELYIDYAKTGSHYYLFTLDHKENIEFVQIDKNSTFKIDNLVKSFREDVNTILNETKITDEKLITLTQSSKETLSQLYELIINKPLENTIKNKTSLIISPDGALRLLPFETLYNKEKGKYFIEEKEIRYIPSGKELVRLYKYSKDKKAKAAKSAVIFSNPNFNTKIASISKEQIAITPNTNRSGIIKSLFRMRFDPLPGTKAEAKAIQSTLKKSTVSEYQKEKATESNLMKIKEPNILHIATHGFFINDNTIPNPMLKSGIALAGANASAIKGKSDGIVTALKLSGLDLKGTDLVVLSACQTGVVDINSTDSVSGLSKAFIQAGAKNIVMSLWSVDDEATKALMTSFYQEMKENKNYAKALKSAKLRMIDEGRHPFYWAAFVVSGL